MNNDAILSISKEHASQALQKLSSEQKDLLVSALKTKLRKEAEDSFFSFFRQAWAHIWPTDTFSGNWHYKYLCDEIQKVAERNFKKEKRLYHLNINVPPRSSKSTIVSICFPAWVWIKYPSKKFITTAYSPALALDFSTRALNLMRSDWYTSNWGKNFRITKETPSCVENDRGGYRIITSPGMKIGTGFGGDFIISDDPENAEEIYSDTFRNRSQRWWDNTISTRLNELEYGVMINLQQRLHQDDMTGHLKKEQENLYKFIVLPAEESDDIEPAELHNKYVNGLLAPQRLSLSVLEDKKIQLRNSYSGQFQQNPVALGGNFFKENYVNWFTREQVPKFNRIVLSCDTANTDLSTSCPVSLQVWGDAMPRYYLLYDETQIISQIETKARIIAISKMYPQCQVVIELAASGFGIFAEIRNQVPGVFAFPPGQYGGKEARADSIVYLWQAGNIFLPDTQYIKVKYLPELLAFPNGKYKDRVDAMSQALIFMTRGEHKGLHAVSSKIPVY